MNTNYYYKEFFELGQQYINFNLYEIGLPENDPVYTLKEVMEELNFEALLSMYKQRGRKAFNPIMMFALIIYANMRGIRSIDRIVDLCQRDIGFMWLAQGLKPKRDAFYNFINNKVSKEILDDVHYQFIQILKKKKLITLETLFVDGTKIEANANRYTFVWRGTINYHLLNLLDNIQSLYKRYNEFIVNNEYAAKYGLLPEEMFFIEGTKKVKEIILENIKRKRLNKKKLPNKTILEIDNIGPQSIMKIKKILKKLSEQEGIRFLNNKGHKKKYKNKNKKLTINRKWETLKKETEENIFTEKGILYRQIRSIQTEGSFGDMKQNDDFIRFNHRSGEKVYKEALFYVFGRNINKYHRFKTSTLTEFKGKVV